MQIVELLVQQLNANLVQKAITISVTDDAKKWILEKTLVGAQLRGAAVAARAAAVRRRSAVGGADRRADSGAAGVPRGLSRDEPAVLSAGKRGRDCWRREGGGRFVVRQLICSKAQRKPSAKLPGVSLWMGVPWERPARQSKIGADILSITRELDDVSRLVSAGMGCDCCSCNHGSFGSAADPARPFR